MTHPDPSVIARLLALSPQEGALPDTCPVSAVGELKKVLGDQGLLGRALPDEVMRRRAGTLGPDQSQQVYRLAAVWLLAVEVFQDGQKARGLLARPHSLLSGRSPIKVGISSAAGLAQVTNLLGRLKHGSTV